MLQDCSGTEVIGLVLQQFSLLTSSLIMLRILSFISCCSVQLISEPGAGSLGRPSRPSRPGAPSRPASPAAPSRPGCPSLPSLPGIPGMQAVVVAGQVGAVCVFVYVSHSIILLFVA